MSFNTAPLRSGVVSVDTWSPPTRGTFRYIDIGSIDRVTKTIASTTEHRVENAPSRARQVVHAGDVIVSTVRPNLNAVAMVPDELEGAIASTGFTVIRANPRILLPQFVFHWVRTALFVTDMNKKATGASYPAVSDRIVLESEIPLPPVDEQRRIAAILDKADAIRRKRQEALALTEQLLRSTFLEMFGDLSANPRDWTTVDFGEIIADGPTNGLYVPASEYGQGVPIVRIDSFMNGSIAAAENLKRVSIPHETLSRFRVSAGQILINRVNSPTHLGKAALVPHHHGDLVFESNMMRIALDRDRVVPEFVIAHLQSEYIRSQISTCRKDASNQSSINQADVRGFRFRLPPLGVQQKYRMVCDSIMASDPRHRQALEAADALFASLTHRAFTGQL